MSSADWVITSLISPTTIADVSEQRVMNTERLKACYLYTQPVISE